MEIISAIATILGVITALWFFYDKYRNHKNSTTLNNTKHTQVEPKEALRDIENNNHIKFIDSLPEEKMVIYKNSQKKWDTGITSDMQEGNYDVIDFMKNTWLKLSEFYTEANFEGKSSKEYIDDYIKKKFEYHWSKHMPNGEFQGGTIIQVMVGGDVIEDLENLIIDLIATISFYNDNFDYLDWKKDGKL